MGESLYNAHTLRVALGCGVVFASPCSSKMYYYPKATRPSVLLLFLLGIALNLHSQQLAEPPLDVQLLT